MQKKFKIQEYSIRNAEGLRLFLLICFCSNIQDFLQFSLYGFPICKYLHNSFRDVLHHVIFTYNRQSNIYGGQKGSFFLVVIYNLMITRVNYSVKIKYACEISVASRKYSNDVSYIGLSKTIGSSNPDFPPGYAHSEISTFQMK